MTAIAYDGETLATDSLLFGGKDSEIKCDYNFNKIWFVRDFVFSVCGNESDYFKLENQLKKCSDFDSLMLVELSSDSEAIIFWKQTPKQYFTHDGNHIIINEIKTPTTLGAVEDYAFALLHSGMKSENIIKQCIKRHTGAGGKVRSINIKEWLQ